MVTLIVVLAIYVSFGRLLMSNVEHYHRQILKGINARLPFIIEAQKVGGEWHFFSPELVFTGLKLTIPNSTEPPLELTDGRVTVDVLESLQTGSLKVSKLLLNALSLKGALSEEGAFSITGFGNGNPDMGEWLEEFLLNIESVDLTNNRLALSLPNDKFRQLELDLALRRNGSSRLLEANIRSKTSGTSISVVAEGVGNPLIENAFVGELYLDVDVSDLWAVQQLVNRSSPVDIEGELQAEFWLGWDRGESTVALNLHGTDLELSAKDGSWRLPADDISMQASLEKRNDHWTVFVSDFELFKGDIQLQLPRLQLDTWGDSLRVRTYAVPLAPLNALLVDLSLTPDAIADVFHILNARGEMSAAQLDIAEIADPGDDWQFSANFRKVKVDSWRGAPGVASAKGYVELARDGGYVVLDSQSFAMDFPTVYKQPLFYNDVYGTINIDWDADDLKLSSGLLSLSGEEGLARVLFGLNIPLVKNTIGLEMDLLVGLENFDPSHRNKYLPYILSNTLLDWLAPSIGQGRIEQGAFLWRGNLRENMPALKTIQLFFNIADTQLNYHPQWPPVSEVDGIVLIDDTDVSVWSHSGTLYNSGISYISAEAWTDDQHRMVLAIDGQLLGAAEDGLAVVNNSPIAEIVGPVFANWNATGQLQTQLQLQVILNGEPQPPQIDVKTVWQGVDLHVNPGNLIVSNINGVLSYSSEMGFASNELMGELWGHPVAAQLSQSASTGVEVLLDTHVDMADIQRWLDVDILAFAKGETEADIHIRVQPEEGATLWVESELRGVVLDLPEPWGKPADQLAPLMVKFPLGGAASLLELELRDNLQLHLQISDGKFTGAALGLYDYPAEVETGVLRVSGHSPLVDIQQWQDFIFRYVEGDLLASIEAGGGMAIEVDKVGADTLVLFGQDLRDVVFSLESEAGAWNIAAETEWFSGALGRDADGEVMSLAVEFLNVDGLAQLNVAAPAVGEPLQLPDMTVSLRGLYKGSVPLGEMVFDVRTNRSTLIAENIVGTLAGLEVDVSKPASLSWFQDEQGGSTALDAFFRFGDLSNTLELLGYQKILETESGQFDMALQWPGAPHNFSLGDTRGSLAIALGEGSFLSAPAGASGALRVINILNLAEIIGQLSLSHVFKSGIAFHSVDGEIFLHDGSIEVANLQVDGSTSGFQFNGVADVDSESLEGSLVVTLPVANNLPWIVALTAGLPVAAGVFVVSKLFKKQVNRVASGVYNVTGAWDNPQVTLERIFDDASRASLRSEVDAAGRGQQGPSGTPEVMDTSDLDETIDQLDSKTTNPADPNQAVVHNVSGDMS